MDTALVWFRDDLRITDNPTLLDAVEAADRLLPVYVFDPESYGESEYGPPKTGPHRARFRRESVRGLRDSLRERGGELFVRRGDPARVVPELAEAFGADAVFAQTKPATEELAIEAAVGEALAERDVAFERRWTHTLYHVDDLPTPCDDIQDTFTPWRKTVEDGAEIRPPKPAPETVSVPESAEPGPIPALADLGVESPPDDDRAVLGFEGGETAGKARVESYFWEGDHLRNYKGTRNGLVGADYSSKLSPWLAAGCLSPRWIDREVTRYEGERVENEDTYWLVFELVWRDFFQFQFRKHGGSFFTPGGIRDVETSWNRDRAAFERWADGETGIPFVDANMRELNRTGYISNRDGKTPRRFAPALWGSTGGGGGLLRGTAHRLRRRPELGQLGVSGRRRKRFEKPIFQRPFTCRTLRRRG